MTTSPDDVPYADPEPFSELIEECRCAQAECAAHTVDLQADQQPRARAGTAPVIIDDEARHLVDGYSDYGG